MKLGLALLSTLAAFSVIDAPLLAQPRGREDGARFGWLSSLEEGKSQARKTGKPLMVVVRCVP